jgi:hypothetical protein
VADRILGIVIELFRRAGLIREAGLACRHSRRPSSVPSAWPPGCRRVVALSRPWRSSTCSWPRCRSSDRRRRGLARSSRDGRTSAGRATGTRGCRSRSSSS